MKEVIKHLESMAETLDGVTEENWLDTPQDIAQIYRSVANEIKDKMSAQNQSVTNCNQFNIREALKAALPIMKDCPFTHYDTTQVDKVVVGMEAALRKPPRNCDVGTAEEQVKRFNKFCLFHKCDECQLNNDANFLECGVRWGQLPYESEVRS
jgi:hypothetical protein